jgi:hypothetical protein
MQRALMIGVLFALGCGASAQPPLEATTASATAGLADRQSSTTKHGSGEPRPDSDDGPGRVVVRLRGDRPGLRYTLMPVGGVGDFAGCPRSRCEVRLLPGRYLLHVEGGDDASEGTRTVTIVSPSLLRVSPRSQSTRYQGLALGLAGSAMVVAALASGLLVGPSEHRGDGETRLLIGGLALGLVATPIGWITFGQRNPVVEAAPLSTYALAR